MYMFLCMYRTEGDGRMKEWMDEVGGAKEKA